MNFQRVKTIELENAKQKAKELINKSTNKIVIKHYTELIRQIDLELSQRQST